ncbi:MAG TPA: radical SAM protein [Bdellovibrionales bacterium]|nr:radical SAM protein [Bdellovibrionales bacterium]
MESPLKNHFERVYVHESARGSRLAARAAEFFGAARIEWVSERPLAAVQGALSPSEFERSKRQLFITRFEGAFFKQCPGAQNVACCNYFVLNLGQQCNMNCSYCYLQSYLNSPLLTLYSNIEDALQELAAMRERHADLPIRIGTGEVMDSLSLDELTRHSVDLIEFFKTVPKWKLEFKTKSDNVGQFLDRSHAGNVFVSWSINPQYVISREEHGTATLERRLVAARQCADRGFKIAFHIDPMIWHPEWRENYGALIDRLMELFTPDELPQISVGALRFQPDQRHMMRARFGMESLVTSGELFLSRDGKLRYDQATRNEMFKFVVERFRANSPLWKVWLCMESPESWLSTFESTPRNVKELEPLFRPLPNPKALGVAHGGLR